VGWLVGDGIATDGSSAGVCDPFPISDQGNRFWVCYVDKETGFNQRANWEQICDVTVRD